VALARGVSPAITRCELTFLEREPIDYPRAVAQHGAYVRLLEDLGLRVVQLEADAELPDCFVEDIAIVLDEVAVLTRPGAPSRRGETAAVAAALQAYRPIVQVEEPARIDGGDVLVLGRRLFVGLSNRTDDAGRQALANALRPFDYEVVPVPIEGCLHLKTAVTAASADVLVVNPEWVDLAPLRGLETIAVAPGERGAANVLSIGGTVVAAAGFPRTADRLRARGLDVRTVDVSEFQKAEGGVTCKSLVFDVAEAARPE
jgi:dimethylargininase